MEYISQSTDKQKLEALCHLYMQIILLVKAIGGFKESPTAFRKC